MNKMNIIDNTKSVFDLLQNVINQTNYLEKTKNKSYYSNKNYIDTFNNLFAQCMQLSGSILSNSQSRLIR